MLDRGGHNLSPLTKFLSWFSVSITHTDGAQTYTSILIFYTQVLEADPAMFDRVGHNF